jgi:hypothetical protein
VAVRIDQPDGDADGVERSGDLGAARRADVPEAGDRPTPVASGAESERQDRVNLAVEHRATVDAAYRAYAVDQVYEKVRDIERGAVTPAMKRIEAEDPERHLAGLENSLKGKDRLAEKVNAAMTERGRSADQAVGACFDRYQYLLIPG